MVTTTFKSLFTFASTALLLAQSGSATPLIAERGEAATSTDPSDAQIMNFALTLEHLESAFYKEAMDKFSEGDFGKDGFPSWVRGRFNQMKEHEWTHVGALSGALDGSVVRPCTYNFPYNRPQEFVILSAVLEHVGASAYLGAAKYLKTSDHLTLAGSMLSVEARQSSWVMSSVLKHHPWSGPFDVPLSLLHAYTLASGFIKDCPAGNAAHLPSNMKAFPALTIKEKSYDAGKTITIQYEGSHDDLAKHDRFLACMSGDGTTFVPIAKDGKVTIPSGLQGTAYGIVTSDTDVVKDSNTVAGPVVLILPFGSWAPDS